MRQVQQHRAEEKHAAHIFLHKRQICMRRALGQKPRGEKHEFLHSAMLPLGASVVSGPALDGVAAQKPGCGVHY